MSKINATLKKKTQTRTRELESGTGTRIKISTWDDEFELPDGSYSVSVIQEYMEYIINNTKHYPLILLLIITSIGLLTD